MFKPMLACKIKPPFTDLAKIKYPVLASRKLDGIRATVQDGRLLSRKLKDIPNLHVQKLFGKSVLNGLDGELIMGVPTAHDVFRRTSSAVMSHEGEPYVMFRVFDKHSLRCFEERLQAAWKLIRHFQPRVQLVEHTLVHSRKDLLTLESEWLDEGYEGLMLRDPQGLYKQGRSTLREGGLIALKRRLDGEAVVLDIEEQMHNANEAEEDALGHTKRSSKTAGMQPMGVLGAVFVRDLKTKVEFRIGSGFDAADRKKLWKKANRPIGRIVKYSYFPVGVKDKPRHPVFEGFRDPIDM